MSEYIEEAARRIFGENNPEMRPQRPFYCADKLLGGVRIKFDLFDQKKKKKFRKRLPTIQTMTEKLRICGNILTTKDLAY